MGIFLRQNVAEKSQEPLCPLIQTRFFSTMPPKPLQDSGSRVFWEPPLAIACIAFVSLFLIGYHKSIEMSNFFLNYEN
ncbi:hypothetical protein C6495_05055 [Candidatus Poribacteria bacterium]|nr:MAG: hypothetical protein C6495_05055 [Candidatus Poribacteria bacterium]